MNYTELNKIKARHQPLVHYANIVGYAKSGDIPHALAIFCQVANDEETETVRNMLINHFEEKLKEK